MTAAYASHLLELHYRSQFSMKPQSVVIVTAGHEGEVASLNPLQHKRIRPLHGAEAFLRNKRVPKQEIFRLLWHPNVYYRVHKSAALNTVPSRFNPFRTPKHYFCSVHSNIITSMPICPIGRFPLGVSAKIHCLSRIPVIRHAQSISPTLFATVLVHGFLGYLAMSFECRGSTELVLNHAPWPGRHYWNFIT